MRIDRCSRCRRVRAGRRAFTLIELLIVIAILLALGGVVLVNLIPKQEESDIKLTLVQIDQFESAMKLFKLAMKRYPTEDEGLASLWNKDQIQDEDEAARWSGPYLEAASLKDTWGSEWIYRSPSETEGFEYDIVSLGPDRQEQTDDDITNHDRFTGAGGEVSEEFTSFDSKSGSGGGTRTGGP